MPNEKTTSESTEEKPCPKCGTIMRYGFIVERNNPLDIITAGSGVYWTPDEAGTIGTRCAIEAPACPKCGYVELYLRRITEDRDRVLGAPTTPPERIERISCIYCGALNPFDATECWKCKRDPRER